MSIPPRPIFSLAGPSVEMDPRVNAVRGDLADIALAGRLFVPHYARPQAMTCTVDVASVRESGDLAAKQTTELLFGEDFMVIDVAGGFAWGYCRHDHYVGYIALTDLGAANDTPRQMITVRAALVLDAPRADANIIGHLPMGAQMPGTANGDYFKTPKGYVPASATDNHFADAVAVAEALIGTPYVWGGRSGKGIDCSGLVQLALALTGKASAPRDSDQQQHTLGRELGQDEALQRNDLIFFPGHVGFAMGDGRFIHANGTTDSVAIEALDDVISRFADHETPIAARKRID